MSSGPIGNEDPKTGKFSELEQYEHQVVVITLRGKINKELVERWNDFMKKFKEDVGDRMIAVTIGGSKTPKAWKKRK